MSEHRQPAFAVCAERDISGRHTCEREQGHKGPHCKFGAVSVMAWGGDWSKVTPVTGQKRGWHD